MEVLSPEVNFTKLSGPSPSV